MTGVSNVLATTNGSYPQTWKVTDYDARNSAVSGLTAYTDFEVSLEACYADDFSGNEGDEDK